MSNIEQPDRKTGFVLSFEDPNTKRQFIMQLAASAGLYLGEDVWGQLS